MDNAKNRIMIIGDLHGEWGKLNALICKKNPDIILQCGDFGWWPKMEIRSPILYGRKNDWKLKGIKPGGTKIYWCDGNHEEFSHLKQNGKINEKYKNIFHASRGSILQLNDGRNILFAGGAFSADRHLRTPGHDWFPEEAISNLDFDRMMAHDKIDIVISHTCPKEFDIKGLRLYEKINDPCRKALSEVLKKYRPDFWFFGHWHTNVFGKYENTKWQCLDYPGNRGRWWMWLS